ncbi:MAG: F0F1 ATP synthase subunit A [Candidatus Marinimicrobia bacterium]|nr:F0F1 ATP synthase subunit A [Candidatus Neomarinimicrobiota bacterium]MCH8068959.1 F0F1 ATP synthase subunit A [Candidatus Neomarinimicrobiota bacterium]
MSGAELNPGKHGSIIDEIGQIIVHHVSNSGKLVELPTLFGIDFSISKHVIMLWVSAVVVFVVIYFATARYRKERYPVPRGFANAFESVVEYLRSHVVLPNVGKEDSKLWGPVVFTLFFFILTANLLGLVPLFDLIPGGSTPTGNFNVTAGLATVTFFSIIIAGSIKHGFFGHWKGMIHPGLPIPVYFILIPIEIVGMFVKPFALTMRLAANMTGGHIAILSVMSFIFVFGEMFSPTVGVVVGAFVSVPLGVGIYALEIIVAFIQAFVFALLTSIFVGIAIHPHH